MAPITRYLLSVVSSFSSSPRSPTPRPLFTQHNHVRRNDTQLDNSRGPDSECTATNATVYSLLGYAAFVIVFLTLAMIFLGYCSKRRSPALNQGVQVPGVQAYTYNNNVNHLAMPAPAVQHGNYTELQPIGLLTTERVTAVQAPKLAALRNNQTRSDGSSAVGTEGDQEPPSYEDAEQIGSPLAVLPSYSEADTGIGPAY